MDRSDADTADRTRSEEVSNQAASPGGDHPGPEQGPADPIDDPGTVTHHLEAALEKTDDEEVYHHVRHALLYLGRR